MLATQCPLLKTDKLVLSKSTVPKDKIVSHICTISSHETLSDLGWVKSLAEILITLWRLDVSY